MKTYVEKTLTFNISCGECSMPLECLLVERRNLDPVIEVRPCQPCIDAAIVRDRSNRDPLAEAPGPVNDVAEIIEERR